MPVFPRMIYYLAKVFCLLLMCFLLTLIVLWHTTAPQKLKKHLPKMKHVKRNQSVRNNKCFRCFKWQFNMILKPSIGKCENIKGCNVEDIDLILLIASKHSNLDHRQLLRKVYDQTQWKEHRLRLLFLFGNDPDHNKTREDLLRKEALINGDILQTHVKGSYGNMTFIVYNGIRWAIDHYPNARFIGKISDDTILNIPGIFKLLDTKGESELGHVVFGWCWSHLSHPNRSKGNKWYTSFKSYPFKMYPPYCSGAYYFMSAQTAREMLREAENIAFPTILHDDVDVGLNIQLSGHCNCNIPGFQYFTGPGSLGSLLRRDHKNNSVCPEHSISKHFLGVHLHGLSVKKMAHFWEYHSCFWTNATLLNSIKCNDKTKCRNSGSYPFTLN